MFLSRYERMIAKRYLLPGKGEAFIFLVAGISLAAVMLGVAALSLVDFSILKRAWAFSHADVALTSG